MPPELISAWVGSGRPFEVNWRTTKGIFFGCKEAMDSAVFLLQQTHWAGSNAQVLIACTGQTRVAFDRNQFISNPFRVTQLMAKIWISIKAYQGLFRSERVIEDVLKYGAPILDGV